MAGGNCVSPRGNRQAALINLRSVEGGRSARQECVASVVNVAGRGGVMTCRACNKVHTHPVKYMTRETVSSFTFSK